MRMSTEDRFMKYVECEPNTGCWLWRGGVNNDGYAKFWDGQKRVKGHRYALRYEGPLQVNHTCGVRNCVNPDHLYVGTQSDNMRDRLREGNHPRAKFDRATIEAVLAAEGTQVEIGARFGVSRSVVGQIKRGEIDPSLRP